MSDRRSPLLTASLAARRIKSATHAAILSTPEGSADALARVLKRWGPDGARDIDARSLRKYADHSHEMVVPADVIVELEARCGAPVITSVLADLNGYVVCKKPSEAMADGLSALKETGEAGAAIAALLMAGTRGRDEDGEALREVREALAALTTLERAIAKRVEGAAT